LDKNQIDKLFNLLNTLSLEDIDALIMKSIIDNVKNHENWNDKFNDEIKSLLDLNNFQISHDNDFIKIEFLSQTIYYKNYIQFDKTMEDIYNDFKHIYNAIINILTTYNNNKNSIINMINNKFNDMINNIKLLDDNKNVINYVINNDNLNINILSSNIGMNIMGFECDVYYKYIFKTLTNEYTKFKESLTKMTIKKIKELLITNLGKKNTENYNIYINDNNVFLINNNDIVIPINCIYKTINGKKNLNSTLNKIKKHFRNDVIKIKCERFNIKYNIVNDNYKYKFDKHINIGKLFNPYDNDEWTKLNNNIQYYINKIKLWTIATLTKQICYKHDLKIYRYEFKLINKFKHNNNDINIYWYKLKSHSAFMVFENGEKVGSKKRRKYLNYVNINCDPKDDELIEQKLKNELDWNSISRKPLSEKFINKYYKHLNWRTIINDGHISLKLIDKYNDKITENALWTLLIMRKKLNIEFIKKYKYFLSKDSIIKYQKFPKQLIEEIFKDKYINSYIDK
jgi:hypothetical protein